jgi:putative protease
MKRVWNKPELMSPAGYWPQLKMAIEAGADAVYFGLRHFTARAKVGFRLAELPEVMQTLHARGVKGFVTFNTLVFDHELLEAEEALAAIAEARADAIIVQDVGIAQLARRIAPSLEVYGSTQRSVTSTQGAELAKQCGCAQVAPGRELSLPYIERIAQATDVDLEVFVHGALCQLLGSVFQQRSLRMAERQPWAMRVGVSVGLRPDSGWAATRSRRLSLSALT